MKAVLLVGGEGTRLRPLTQHVPKPLVPVMNIPYLEQLFYFLRKFGVDEIILTTCYLSSAIEAFCRQSDQADMKLTHVVEETPLGTGGAVGNVAAHLTETFLVFNADIITNFNLGQLLQFHKKKKAMMTLALVPVEDPSRFGVADLQADGSIARFIEKPAKGEAPSSFINAGMYVMEPQLLQHIPKGIKFSIEKNFFPSLAEAGSLFGLVEEAYWLDIGTPEGYLQVHRDCLDGKISLKVDGSDETGRERKVIAGEGTRIAPGAKVGPYVVFGRHCRVEVEAEIYESVIWDGVTIGRQAVISGSIVGADTVVKNDMRLHRRIICAEGEADY